MAILFVYTVCSILLFLYDPSTTSSITRSLCLETTFLFMTDPESCAFSYEYANNSLEDKSSTCQTKCAVKIENVSKRKNILWDLDIAFGTASITLDTPCLEKDDYTKLTMIINCPNWNTVNISVGGYCRQDEQCQRSEHSAVCKDERCVCKTGYILFNLKCHEGNLALNQSCSLSEQCVGSPYASCLGGKCSCIEGFTAKNATSCIQSQTSIFAKSQHKEEANIGNTLGALFGGLFLGVILTTVAVVFTYRRSKTQVNKRDELNVKFSDNDAVVDPNAFQNIHTKDGKREVSPYSGSEETSMHNNVYEKLRNGQTQDDVHNHLYEQLK